MSARFVTLLPPDLRESVRGDDLAHFIVEAMEGLDTGRAEAGRSTRSAKPMWNLSLA